MAATVHHGAYAALTDAYTATLQWIGENGLTVAGSPREIYLYSSQPVRQDDPSYVTEVQFPVLHQ